MVKILIEINEDIQQELKYIAIDKKTNVSELIRIAIKEKYFNSKETTNSY